MGVRVYPFVPPKKRSPRARNDAAERARREHERRLDQLAGADVPSAAPGEDAGGDPECTIGEAFALKGRIAGTWRGGRHGPGRPRRT